MNESARIALAEAMGRNVGHFAPNFDIPVFTPFSDANDDFAVLEWVKNKWPRGSNEWLVFTEVLDRPWNYEIGDHARAACRVLNIPGQESDISQSSKDE